MTILNEYMGLLTLIAIISSPVIALWIQKHIEKLSDHKERKLRIFATLLTTRNNITLIEHVQALNSIDIEFS